MRKVWLSGVGFVVLVAVACSSKEEGAPPATLPEAGAADTGAASSGDPTCDEAGANFAKNAAACLGTETAESVARQCKSDVDAAKCKAEMRNLRACQAKGATCEGATPAAGECAAEDAAYTACELPDGGGDSGANACNTVALQLAKIDAIASDDDRPSDTGGAMSDGTYLLTDATTYDSTTPAGQKVGVVGRETIVITGTKIARAVEDATGQVSRSTGTFQISDLSNSLLNVIYDCRFPAGAKMTEVISFTVVNPNRFTFTRDDGGVVHTILGYTKQ